MGDPWVEHALLSPKCCYLLAVRDWEYVNKVTGMKIYETSAEVPIEITDVNLERSNGENDTNEMTLVEKFASLEQENRALKDDYFFTLWTSSNLTVLFISFHKMHNLPKKN